MLVEKCLSLRCFSKMTTRMTAKDMTPNEFGRLFLKYREKFISIARSYTRDEVVAEDIVAESFTNFWDNREKIDIQTVPEAYILQSIRNRCMNWLRDRATRMRIEQNMQDKAYRAMMADLHALESSDMGKIFRSDIERIFRGFLATMPEMTRNVFLDSRFGDMTYAEIAEKYGLSQRKVKRDIQNVLAGMRKSLKDYLPVIAILLQGTNF